MPVTLDEDGNHHPRRLPKIHDAVFGRLRVGAHFYAPIGFPKQMTGDVRRVYGELKNKIFVPASVGKPQKARKLKSKSPRL